MSNDSGYEYLSNESCGKCCHVIQLVCTKYNVFPFKMGKGPFRCKQCVSEIGMGPDWDTDDGRAVIKARVGFVNGESDAKDED